MQHPARGLRRVPRPPRLHFSGLLRDRRLVQRELVLVQRCLDVMQRFLEAMQRAPCVMQRFAPLVPRSPPRVKDETALARRADEPLAPARVAEAKGATPDGPHGHRCGIARAHRSLARGDHRANGALLVRFVLRVLLRQGVSPPSLRSRPTPAPRSDRTPRSPTWADSTGRSTRGTPCRSPVDAIRRPRDRSRTM